jgi:hypothetical protein
MVEAKHFADWDAFDAAGVPGSFSVCEPDAGGVRDFWYRCPCGCSAQGVLRVGQGFKPAEGPSWNWNGSTAAPTLNPSVNHVGHWHGWLRDGRWEL